MTAEFQNVQILSKFIEISMMKFLINTINNKIKQAQSALRAQPELHLHAELLHASGD